MKAFYSLTRILPRHFTRNNPFHTNPFPRGPGARFDSNSMLAGGGILVFWEWKKRIIELRWFQARIEAPNGFHSGQTGGSCEAG